MSCLMPHAPRLERQCTSFFGLPCKHARHAVLTGKLLVNQHHCAVGQLLRPAGLAVRYTHTLLTFT